MSRILIVSNRLPVTASVEGGELDVHRSSGGLANGLSRPHQCGDSLWIGWPGSLPRLNLGQQRQLERRLAEQRTVPVYLSPHEVKGHYEGISNGVLWPLFHYLTDRVPVRNDDWLTYVRVNERFAGAVAAQYRRGDMVWVHDYQLALLPAMLRERIPDARIGFFLHLPFPSSEVFSILPWRNELLRGLLGADLIGFHTSSYLRHFASALLRFLGLSINVDRIVDGEREVRLGVFPMGVDAAALSAIAGDDDVLDQVARIRDDAAGRKIIVGIDRLDYTKGLTQRLLAVERLLNDDPALHDRIRVIQLTVPSREKVDAYAGLRRQLDEIVGRINGRHATANSVPVHNLYRHLDERDVVALYRAADVMLVTPVRDGMNLVAKEFIASRPDGDGVLVLSEFAGAAAELGGAVPVNPYDVAGMAATVRRALDMPEDERRSRMSGMRERVMTHDVNRWVGSFVGSLRRVSADDASRARRSSSDDDIAALIGTLRRAPALLALLDYDGTLVPFRDTPPEAAPDNELLDILRSLAARGGASVHIVSGRTRTSLERWLGALPIGLHAEYGLWSRTTAYGAWTLLQDVPSDWKGKVRPILEHFRSMTPGSLVEEKTASMAWHYRTVRAELGTLQANELRLLLAELLSNAPVEVLEGDKVIEIRPQGVHKGLIAKALLAGQVAPPLVLAMGDDVTDEDLFSALPSDALTVHVGPNPSSARYRLPDVACARRVLGALLD